jgi:hypothetical protein
MPAPARSLAISALVAVTTACSVSGETPFRQINTAL